MNTNTFSVAMACNIPVNPHQKGVNLKQISIVITMLFYVCTLWLHYQDMNIVIVSIMISRRGSLFRELKNRGMFNLALWLIFSRKAFPWRGK